MGCSCAIVFTVFGASYGTAKSAGAIFSSGIIRPDRLMQNTLCAIMAQILSIYGLVVSVIISGGLVEKMALHTGFLQLGAGLAVGLCGLAAGFAIGIVGDAGGENWKCIPSLPPSAPRPPVRCSKCAKISSVDSAGEHPAAQAVCWNGAHPDLCRGAGPLRCHCVHPDAHAVHPGCNQLFSLKRGQA